MLIVLALLIADPVPVADYRGCTVNQAVRLGSGNQETADTILRAVRSVCAPQWSAFYSELGGGLGVAVVERTLARIRTETEESAVAALLEARLRQ